MKMNRKNLILYLYILFFTFLVLTSCANAPEYYYQGETHMGKITTTQLTESLTDEKVMAEVVLTGVDGIVYDTATLEIDGVKVADFNEQGKAVFYPTVFGDVPCQIVFCRGGVESERADDTLAMKIETWFVGAHLDVGHALREIDIDGTTNLLTEPRARGDNDLCFRLVVRVPDGATETITEVCEARPDIRPRYNTKLSVHYRGNDYRNRNDLFTAPDEAMYHIDIETDKWIASPVELSHGVHVLYVVPSVMCDLSFVTVTGNGGYNFSVTSYQKSLDFVALGLVP
jgi:hypothetical protein